MKIVLFGATGNIGRRVAKEALDRGHAVTGVVRDPSRADVVDPRLTLLKGDATDTALTAALLTGSDATVNALSCRTDERGLPATSLTAAARSLIAAAASSGVTRLVVVGGASTLEVAPGVRLLDTPDFPAAYRAEATETAASLAVYRAEGGGVDWTFISPAAEIGPGERTGTFRKTGDQFLADANGKSFISFDDYAVALVDELERPQHIGRRFGVAY